MSFPLPQLLPESRLPTHPTSPSSFLLIISYKTKTTAKQENQNNLKKKITLNQKQEMPKQNTHTKTKQKHQNKHGVHFVLATTGYGSWCAVDKPSITPLEKRDFPSSSRNQLQIAPWLVGEALCPLPLLSAGTMAFGIIHHLWILPSFCLLLDWVKLGYCYLSPLCLLGNIPLLPSIVTVPLLPSTVTVPTTRSSIRV